MTYTRIASLITLLTTERLLLVIFCISVSIAIQGYAPDIYLHLTTGRYILETGELSHTDVFSFTRYGEPWVMHEWLYQIMLYKLHEAYGEIGLQIFGGTILTTILLINKQNCKLVGASNITAWFSTILLFLTWILFIGARPHIITYLFFTLSLYFILLHRHKGRIKPLYLIPVMMAIWVNIHGGFIIGIILLGYIAFLSFIEHYAHTRQWKIPQHLVNSFLLSIFASLINPYGVEQLFFPFRLMDQWVMKYVPEWMPPDFTAWYYAIYAIVVALFLITSLWLNTKDRWFILILAAPFIIASFNSVRHVPLAAFIISPYFAANIYSLLSRYLNSHNTATASISEAPHSALTRFAKSELGIRENVLNWILLGCYISAIYLTYPVIQQKKLNIFKRLFPVGATEYLVKNNIQGRMFTTMQYSNYILYHRYPEQKIFYDVRLETYGRKLSFDYVTMVYAQDNWEELFKKYEIDYVVIDKVEAPYTTFSNNRDFKTLYEDEYSLVFSLPAGGNRDK